VASGEVLRAMVTLPAVTAAGTHAARGPAALFKQSDLKAGFLQTGGAGETRYARADNCEISNRFHFGKIEFCLITRCGATWNFSQTGLEDSLTSWRGFISFYGIPSL
jgi:hypothetical protein